MENRELTNISFKKAMSKVIDKLLKKEAPTPVPKEIDDFETLNSEVFTHVMDEVVESIPESGGGGSFIAHITMDPQTENYTSDKTAAEIYEAYSNGIPCYAYWFSEDFSDSDIAIPLMTAYMVEDKDDPSKITYEIIFGIFTGEFDIYVTITGANVKVEMEEMYDKFLPEVDADDNGSVLTVVEGSWNKAKAAPASGSFIVTLTKNGPAQYTADKTIEEIYQTWKNDPSVYIYDSDEENYYPVVVIYRNGNPGSYTYTLLAMFIGIEYSNGAATLQQYKAMYDSSYGWSVTGSGNPLLPGASVNDEGKILKVVNRTWTASNAPTGGGLIVDFDTKHLTADKTAEEIYTAFTSGLMVMIRAGEVYTFVVDAKTREPDGYDITCAEILCNESDRMMFASISYTDKSGEAGWHLNTYSRSFLPGVDENDDGKILKVVEGSWTVVSPN